MGTKVDDVAAIVKTDSVSPAPLPSPTLPVPLFLWRIFLVIAVFLYSSYTIFIHLCEADGELPFRTTAVVFLVEFLKMILSIIMFGISRDAFRCVNTNGTNIVQAMRLELRRNRQKTSVPCDDSVASPTAQLTWSQLMMIVLPFTVPAILYAINNNLGLLIQLEMDPATYQVLGNFKILSTAILFRLIIKRPITHLQWFALLLLLSAGFAHSYGNQFAKRVSSPLSTVDPLSSTTTFYTLHITHTGILMISLYCTISGLSGVYTEYVMKSRAQMSIHMQNGLLYFFGIFINGALYLFDVLKDSEPEPWNLFEGFGLWTWLLVLTQAVSGIFMGFVMKYSTNITRMFIISSAMVVTTFLAVIVFGLKLNVLFVVSSILVSISLYLYHL